ncbi:MAG: NADH-quinone oxidoreductase subunit F, partial [Myxococcales bacterium]
APLPISAARSRSLAKAEPDEWEDVLSVEKPVHAFKTEPVVAFANIFAKNSHQLATARRHGVYAPVEAALKKPGEQVFEAVMKSGLVGGSRGGYSAARKWEAVRLARGAPKYIVVNADEGEPGTFKDRIILERDPHLLIAGAILAAHALGATDAFIYVRGEYELAAERLRTAVDEANRAGLLGEDILGSGTTLRMHVRLGGGAYLPAEGTALLESLEGRLPRPRDPSLRPEEAGLFGKPTLINNVETLSLVPAIVTNGPDWYRSLGESGAIGMKIFSLSGDVKRPGNYELPRGTPMRKLVDELGGGLGQGKTVTALMVGGGASPLLKPEALDAALSDDALGELGACVGTGAVVVITEKSCLFDLARREIAFFARKSCGACETCRETAREVVNAMDALGADREAAEKRILDAWTQMRESTRCGHAETLAPVRSLLKDFPTAVDAHFAGDCPCNPKKGRRA